MHALLMVDKCMVVCVLCSYPLVRMRSKGYNIRLVRLSFVLSVSLLGGSVSVHSTSTCTWLAFIGHKNHTK